MNENNLGFLSNNLFFREQDGHFNALYKRKNRSCDSLN